MGTMEATHQLTLLGATYCSDPLHTFNLSIFTILGDGCYPFYRWENWNTWRLNRWLQVTTVSCRTRVKSQQRVKRIFLCLCRFSWYYLEFFPTVEPSDFLSTKRFLKTHSHHRLYLCFLVKKICFHSCIVALGHCGEVFTGKTEVNQHFITDDLIFNQVPYFSLQTHIFRCVTSPKCVDINYNPFLIGAWLYVGPSLTPW